jgi:hypothetical protein
MDTVPVGGAVTAAEAVLPGPVQEALGELVGSPPRDGLLVLSVVARVTGLTEPMIVADLTAVRAAHHGVC